jgi:hypothetical protein
VFVGRKYMPEAVKHNQQPDNKVQKNGMIIPPGSCSLVHVYFITAYRPAGNFVQAVIANV